MNGAGLAESLEVAYLVGVYLWDIIPEPTLLMHLHNMLVQKGYIKNPEGLWSELELIFKTEFFPHGLPTSNFGKAMTARLTPVGSKYQATRQGMAHAAVMEKTYIPRLVNGKSNWFFKSKPIIQQLHLSEWDPAGITDDEIPVISAMGVNRLRLTREVVDQETGEIRLADTELWGRAKTMGITPEEVSENITIPTNSKNDTSPAKTLELINLDLHEEICGRSKPILSLNYLSVTTKILYVFQMIEKELQRLRNPLYVQAFEKQNESSKDKRLLLCDLALSSEIDDEECLQTIARVLEDEAHSWSAHTYWDHLDAVEDRITRREA